MRKPSATLFVDGRNLSTSPKAGSGGTRSKRSQSSSLPSRASKRQRTQSRDSVKEIEQCSECGKSKKTDTLMNCIGNCTSKIHRSCLPPQFGKKKGQIYECNACQACSVCKKGFPDGAKLLKCYLCFTCYHSSCYRPNSGENIRMVKEKRFSCACCHNSQKTTTKVNSTVSRVVRSRPVTLLRTVPEASDLETSKDDDFRGFSHSELVAAPLPHRHSKSMENLQSIQNEPNENTKNHNAIDAPKVVNKDRINIDDEDNIPDASQWTTNELYEYFRKIFPRHAHVFADEEIDGYALYLLQREDVVGRFKLGPSVRIYEHIKMMQNKRGNQNFV